jgi:hypothetical protein
VRVVVATLGFSARQFAEVAVGAREHSKLGSGSETAVMVAAEPVRAVVTSRTLLYWGPVAVMV